MIEPDVTVAVCTHNRAEGLREALASLGQLQTAGEFRFEILVVDNASQDHTPAVIAEAGRSLPVPVRGVCELNQGIVPARNRGIAAAQGRWIAFFDDDQLAEPDWLLQLYRYASQHRVRCVGGAVQLKLPAGCQRRLATYCRMLLGESLWSRDPMPYTRRISPGAGNLMVEASVFREIGGFQRAIRGRGEDTDLFHRMLSAGIEAWYVPSAVIHHVIPPERLQDAFFLRHASRMGEDIAEVDAAERGWTRLISRGLLWGLRGGAWQGPRWLLSRLSGEREQALDLRAKLAMTGGYLTTAWNRLTANARTPPAVAHAGPLFHVHRSELNGGNPVA